MTSTSNARAEPLCPPDVGQVIIAIDPGATMGPSFVDRLEHEFAALAAEPGVRLPGDRRHADRSAAEVRGIEVPDDLMTVLSDYAAHGSPARRSP